MSLHYFLKQDSYSLKNSMLWGNCTSHLKEIKSSNTSKENCFHGFMFVAELLPLLGQIVSLIELSSYKILKGNNQSNNRDNNTLDNKKLIDNTKKDLYKATTKIIYQTFEIGVTNNYQTNNKEENVKSENFTKPLNENIMAPEQTKELIKENILKHTESCNTNISSIQIKTLNGKSYDPYYYFVINFDNEEGKNKYLNNADICDSKKMKRSDRLLKNHFLELKDKNNILILSHKRTTNICGVKRIEALKYLKPNVNQTIFQNNQLHSSF